MCKKITLVIAAVVLLVGVQSLIAQEREGDRPRESGLRDAARPAERQPAMREGAERGDVEPGRRERARMGDQPTPQPPEAVQGRRRPAEPAAPVKTGPVQEEFSRNLDELTKAYRANDRERMGEIIRQMQQFRQRVQMPGKVSAEPPRDYQPSPKVKKMPAGPEKKAIVPGKKAPEPGKKASEPTKKPPQVRKDPQGGPPGVPGGLGVCPWCGRCPRCGVMGGRRMGMGFQQGGFGRGRPSMTPPMDRQAPPMPPKDIPGSEPLMMRRGMGMGGMGMGGWWRPDLPTPKVRKPMSPEPKMD